MPDTPDRAADARPEEAWPPARVRGLRAHLGLSQEQLAGRLGTRQQTVSEWETGARAPRRMSRRLLHLVAEESGFYAVGGDPGPEARRADGTDAGPEAAP